MKMMQVRWTDANFDRDDDPGIARVTSVGWLVRDDDEALVLAAEVFDDGSFRDYTVIPACCVVWTAVLEVPKVGGVAGKAYSPILHGGADLPYGEAP